MWRWHGIDFHHMTTKITWPQSETFWIGKCKWKETSWQEALKKSVQYPFSPDFTLTWRIAAVCVLLAWYRKPTVSFHPVCRVGSDLRLAATEILYNLQNERAASLERYMSVASCSCCLSQSQREIISQEDSRILQIGIAFCPCLKWETHTNKTHQNITLELQAKLLDRAI